MTNNISIFTLISIVLLLEYYFQRDKKPIKAKEISTPNKPRPAIMGAIFIPQISSVAAKPKKIIKILLAFTTQFSRSLDKSSSTLLIR